MNRTGKKVKNRENNRKKAERRQETLVEEVEKQIEPENKKSETEFRMKHGYIRQKKRLTER